MSIVCKYCKFQNYCDHKKVTTSKTPSRRLEICQAFLKDDEKPITNLERIRFDTVVDKEASLKELWSLLATDDGLKDYEELVKFMDSKADMKCMENPDE